MVTSCARTPKPGSLETSAPVELDRLLVYRTANDMLAECWLYDQDQALVDRVLSG